MPLKARQYKAIINAKGCNRRLITLYSFLDKTIGRNRVGNNYVYEPGWNHLYLRSTLRHFDGILRPVIDLANIAAKHTGKGAFTRLASKIRRRYPEIWIYVENVMTSRFENHLVKMGFQYDPQNSASLYLKP